MNIQENLFSKIDSIKNDVIINDKITFKKRDIDKYEKEIEEYEKEIDKKLRKEISLINKLREIDEDENNHIDNIICNKLKDEKNEDYKNKKDELFESLRKGIKYEETKILNYIQSIESSKEEIRKLEFARSQSIFTELEKTRNKILIKFGDYIYDYEENKKLIDILSENNNY
jgi:chromosome segregation ATPase